MASPTSRTLAYLRDNGWTADVVEKWLPFVKIRKDLFGCIDILAINGQSIMGVQATSTPNVNARIKKAQAEPRMALWKQSGGLFAVAGWAKRGKRGERKTWQLKWVSL